MVALSKRGFKISVSNFIDAKAASLSPALHVVYDKSLTDATITDKSIKEWISVNFGPIDFEGTCEGTVEVFILTREDSEGLASDALFDTIMNFFSDPDMPDGNKRIPFYEVKDGALVQTSTMWLARITPMKEFTLLDETKVCPTVLTFAWSGSL
jgi:hypothetical protein